MSYHNRRTSSYSAPNTSVETTLPNTNERRPLPNTDARRSLSNINSNSSVVSVDADGKTTCICADGTTYTNCGTKCLCCRKISKKAQEKKIETKYKTTSCPCSSYAITNSFGDIECEMDITAGSKRRLKAVVIKNHVINGAAPRVRDKWDCGNDSKIPCGEGEVKWETLHIVQTERREDDRLAIKVNTKSSNSNCHIPPTTLVEYIENAGGSIDEIQYSDIGGVDITNPDDEFNGVLLFKDETEALYWDAYKGTGYSRTSEYLNKDGVTMYFPGVYYPNRKLITSAHVNNRDILKENINSFWDYKSNSPYNRFSIKTGGEIIKIKLVGINNPIVDITIKNSSGRNILKRKIQAHEIKNEYVLQQRIPGLSTGKQVESYDICITPSASTNYFPALGAKKGSGGYLVEGGAMKLTLWQYKKSKITISPASSSLANTAVALEGDSVISGDYGSEIAMVKPLVQTIKLTRSSGTHLFYINQEKSRNINQLESQSVISMKIKGHEDGSEMKNYKELTLMETGKNTYDHFYSRKDENGVEVTEGTIQAGMQFSGTFTKTATIKKSIDLDIDLHEACVDDEIIEIFTNKFELDTTEKLAAGMLVKGTKQNGRDFVALLSSVDCEKSITISSHMSIKNDTLLTFTISEGGTVSAVNKDKSMITSSAALNLPENTIVKFVKQKHPSLRGNISFDRSGTSSITITNTVNNVEFGEDDHVFNFDIDSYVTTKPNAYDQRLETFSDQDLLIDFLKFDKDYNKTSKTITDLSTPAKGSTSSVGNDRDGGVIASLLTYTPVRGFTGNDKIKFTVTDANGQVSDEKTIFITIK
tara:strand:+ start:2503 stop:4956 length:2454 start_codon:yes stop_codon:yes gene_type:complete